MKSSLLITGAGGFLGREVLAQLDFSKYRTVYCLARRPGAVKIPKPIPPNIEIITGDLMNTTSYESILAGVDTVVHMAAITGKVNPMDYFRVNEEGTKMLLEQCRQNNVCRFIFVSSIAVSFKNKYRYFYALSKEKAEMHVRESGLAYTILRPTMIMGRGSAVFEGMARLAGLPVMPVFGKGRHPIQPVHVRDAARAVITVLDDQTDAGPYLNQVLEVGGPDTISMLDFMKKIPALKGTGQPPVFHLPLGLIIFGLSVMERLVYRFLPLSVGQLASFRNHSCVQDNPLQQTLAPEMVGLDSMIMDSLNADDPGNDHPKTVLPKSSEDGTDRQCRVFCRYLVRGGYLVQGAGGREPNDYVKQTFRQCHEQVYLAPTDFHDALLLKLASLGPVFTRTADAYSRFFRPGSVVRKKLTYLMAILEVSPPYSRYFDGTDGPGKIGFLWGAAWRGVGLGFHLMVSAIFLLPLQVVAKLTGGPKGGGD